MDSDLTYNGLTGDEHWVPLDIVIEALQTGGQRLYVDAQAWAGIHIPPGDTVAFQPVVKIFNPDHIES